MGKSPSETHDAAAIEAAGPSANDYGRTDSIVGMPCGQTMGGQTVRIPLLSLSTILDLTTPWGRRMGANWIVVARLRDQSANGEEHACARFGDRRSGCAGYHSTHARKERECAHLGKNTAGHGI